MKNKYSIDLKVNDPLFDKESSRQCSLVVGLSYDRIACAAFDLQRQAWVAMESGPGSRAEMPGQLLETLVQFREMSSMLQFAYNDVRLIWGSAAYTLVPEALFDEHAGDAYLRFTQPIPAGHTYAHEKVRKLEAVNIFSLPLVLREGLGRLFPGARVHHHITVLAGSLALQSALNPATEDIFLQLATRSFDLIVINNGKLTFCNSFEFKTAEDLIYYVLFVFEQLNIDPAKAHISLCGGIDRPSAIYDMLVKYIARVNFAGRNPASTYSYVFDEVPGHMHYTLLNILSCV